MKHDWTFERNRRDLHALRYSISSSGRSSYIASITRRTRCRARVLLNIKSGGCPEDCAYCPQSAHYKTGVDRTELVSVDEALAAAARARASRARRGSAWARRGATCRAAPQFDRVLEMVRGVRALGMEACCTLGMLDAGSGRRARRRRPDRVQPQPRHLARVLRPDHHDAHLRRSARHARARRARPASRSAAAASSAWARVATRALRLLQQLAVARPASRERADQPARRASTARRSADRPPEDPLDLVRMIATARILMPQSFVRLSAGRLSLSDEAQALCFLAGANSVFLGDRLLTTPNPTADVDRSLFERLGLRLQAATRATKTQVTSVADSSLCSLWRRVDARMRSLDESGLLRSASRARPASTCPRTTTSGLANHPRIKQRDDRRPSLAKASAALARACCAASARASRHVEARFARFKRHRTLAVFLERLSREPGGA